MQKESKKNLFVILFDEIELDETIHSNPLKVINNELDNNQEIGIVGIIKSASDASLMNRAINISNQEPDLEDLILTANTIAYGIFKEIEISFYRHFIENLTKTYFDYKDYIKKNYASRYDFHGLRDFYYLIKIAARAMKNEEKKSLERIAMESIERNFGGMELDKGNTIFTSIKIFKEIFCKIQNNYVEDINKYDIFNCIKNNLESGNDRYLLLITNKTKNEILIELILKKLKKEYKFIQGSKLSEDQSEDYVLDKSQSIISYIEKGEIVILKDLDIIYPKFYDLFDQNFKKYSNIKYSSISSVSKVNESYKVDDNFRCIVLLEQSEIDEYHPSFLNRFEKHIISFKYLLTESQNNLAKDIYREIKDLTSFTENKKIIPLLVNINLEEIRCLLLNISSYSDNDIDKHIFEIYKLLIPTFTQENILNAVFSQQIKFIKKEDLVKIYEENTHTNIFKFLENARNNRLMIYTFSPYYRDIFKDNSYYYNKIYGTLCKDNTIEITISKKLSEKKLNYFFKLYYEKENYNLLVIHFKLIDSKYLKYIKYQLDEFNKTVKECAKKIFLFIIYIEKNCDVEIDKNIEDSTNIPVKILEKYHSYFLSFLSEYNQITIDNLLEQRNISVIELFNKANEELLFINEFYDIKSVIKNEFSRQIIQIPLYKESNTIIEKLDNLEKNGALECIINKIRNIFQNYGNILRKIFFNYSSSDIKDYDFISYFIERIVSIISYNVEKIIKELGKNNYLVPCFFDEEIPQKFKKTIFSFITNIKEEKKDINEIINDDESIKEEEEESDYDDRGL